MRPKNDLPIEILREHLEVRENGLVYWKFSRRRRILSRPAGTQHPRGYWQISLVVDGINYRLYSHRVIFAMINGFWPPEETDHKNEIKGDNVIDNLRSASCSENKCNRGKQANNTSGLKWVKFDKRRRKPWRAAVRLNGSVREKGGFSTKEAAFTWASIVEKQLHGEFYNPG